MTKYIVSWRDTSGEQEISFVTIAAASSFARATMFEAVGEVIISEEDACKVCRKGAGQ